MLKGQTDRCDATVARTNRYSLFPVSVACCTRPTRTLYSYLSLPCNLSRIAAAQGSEMENTVIVSAENGGVQRDKDATYGEREKTAKTDG